MTAFDSLRPPSATDPSAPAYKDWFHVNFFDVKTDTLGLINVSLHGPPSDPRSRVVGVGLAIDLKKEEGWTGGIEILSFNDANVDLFGISLSTISVNVTPDHKYLHAVVSRADDGLDIHIIAEPVASSFDYDLKTPFGSGWISWSAVPLLTVKGQALINERSYLADQFYAYHDHNWGRWFWGDDAAWEWGAFFFPEIKAILVIARACDKSHEIYGPTHMTLTVLDRHIHFPSNKVVIQFNGRLNDLDLRIPGALATIHTDRRHPNLPKKIQIQAENMSDVVSLTFIGKSVAQLLLAEPTRPGNAFIHEISGATEIIARVGGEEIKSRGIGVFEYVE